MRRIGTLADRRAADQFVAFLTSVEIVAHHDATGSMTSETAEVDVWVREESDVAAARDHLTAFRADPATERFAKFEQIKAQPPRRKVPDRRTATPTPFRPAAGPRIRWLSPGALHGSPATLAVVALILAGGMLTHFAGPGSIVADEPLVGRLTPPTEASVPVAQWYRFLAPAILFENPICLFLHLVAFFWFGSVLERLIGTYPAVAMWAVWQAVGGVAQWAWWRWLITSETMWQLEDAIRWFGSPVATGGTAMLCGTIGYLALRPWLDRSLPLRIPAGAIIAMIALLGLASTSFINVLPVMAGWAGLGAGLVTALLPLARAPE